MRGWLLFAIAAILLMPAYLFLDHAVWTQRAEVRRSSEVGFVIPPQFSRILALDYKGVLSDYLLLKTITFHGERILAKQKLNPEDWRYFIDSLTDVTHLDPYFLDPYLLAESSLAWGAGKYKEANKLLEFGMKYRTQDWQLPFFVGFNYFYFLKDDKRGGEYLMRASRLPGSPSFLPTLAARLDYYGNRAQTAIVFLKSLLLQTKDEKLHASLEKRLLALERAAKLEKLVVEYRKNVGHPLKKIEDLVRGGYLKELPVDPYGGRWILLSNGRVYSTSRFANSK